MRKAGRFRPCEVCETPVWATPYDEAHGRKRFCSPECRCAARRKHEQEERVCRHCEKRYVAGRIRREFCCLQCANAHKNATLWDRRRELYGDKGTSPEAYRKLKDRFIVKPREFNANYTFPTLDGFIEL